MALNNKLRKILVIDDEEDLCLIIKENLENTGAFIVVTATNPSDAEKICESENPNVILLDIVMPERNGTEIIKSLKNNPSFQKIPIVVMSGLGELVYKKNERKWKWLPNRPVVFRRGEVVHERIPRLAADAYGVEGYIAKPFTTTELLSTINDALKYTEP